jgi:hypothetical protein
LASFNSHSLALIFIAEFNQIFHFQETNKCAPI